MNNPFKKSLKIVELDEDMSVIIKHELQSLKENFCGELSKSPIVSFCIETEHFVVKFKVKKYGK